MGLAAALPRSAARPCKPFNPRCGCLLHAVAAAGQPQRPRVLRAMSAEIEIPAFAGFQPKGRAQQRHGAEVRLYATLFFTPRAALPLMFPVIKSLIGSDADWDSGPRRLGLRGAAARTEGWPRTPGAGGADAGIAAAGSAAGGGRQRAANLPTARGGSRNA